jgi:hypothetical protein
VRRLLASAGNQALRGLRALVGQALSYRVLSRDVKREAWALGGRHRGEVLLGARLEFQAPELSFRRAGLLKAVIRSEAALQAATFSGKHGKGWAP